MVRAAWARASYERRCNLTESHAIHRWEMLRDRLPAVALVLTHPQGPCRRAEREPVPRLVHVERVAIGEIVGVLLRQSLREHLEAFAPIPRARHDDPALHGDALLVAHARHEPGGVRVVGMHRDREAEPRGFDRGDLLPRRRAVGGAEHAIVVLDPKGIGLGPTLDQVVRILNVGIILTLGRHVRRAHRADPRRSNGGRAARRRRRTILVAWDGATATRPAATTTRDRRTETTPRAACRTTASPARCRVPPRAPTPARCSRGWVCRNWAPGRRSPRAWVGTPASRTAPICAPRPASDAA